MNSPANDEVRDPALRRNVYVFGLTSFLNDTASETAYWILPAFLTSVLGAGPAALGLIEGVAESVASLAKLFSGYVADRVERRKPIVTSGYAVANVAKPFLALATAWWHVLIIRFADRLAKGVRGAPRDVMLAESVPKARLGGAFGLLQAMDSAGAVAGPLLAIALLPRYGFRTVFVVAAVPGLISVLVVWFAARETKSLVVSRWSLAGAGKKSNATPIESRAIGSISRSESSAMPSASIANDQRPTTNDLPSSFYFVLAAVTLFSLGNSSDMFLVLRAQDVGIRAAMAPLLGLVFNVTYTAASWPMGRLSDRLPKRAVAAAGYLVFAVTYAVFAWAPSRAAIWGAMAFYGLFYALTNPVLRALVAQTVQPETRGRAFGIFYFATSIAVLGASLMTGELWKHYGAPLPFFLSAGLAIAAAVMLVTGARAQS